MTTTASHSRTVLILALLFAGACGLALLSLCLGHANLSVSDVFHALTGSENSASAIIATVRLPRILTAGAVGFGLAMAGTVFQGLLHNPLADPFTLGVSTGAAFGASICLLLGLTVLGTWTIPALAFAGALLTLFAVLAMARKDDHLSPTSLILSGVIVAAILSAGISFIKYLADEQVAGIVFWLMGSFAARTMGEATLCWTAALLSLGLFLFYARDLNLMSLGDRAASSLGVETRRVRMALLVAASLVSGVCVSVSGIIGFVGLIIPHLMRLALGPDNRALIPASALGGTILLMGADTISRALLPHEVPIGVLTALLGGPVFCYLFRTRTMGERHD